MAKTYTFEKPETTIQMTALITLFNKTTSAAKRDALRKLFDEMACAHGYIKVLYRWYHWNGIDWISSQRDNCNHTCPPEEETPLVEETETPEGEDEDGFENPEITLSTHTCACGAPIVAFGWNNYNKVLRCQACEAKRSELIASIRAAICGKPVEIVYVPVDQYHLLNIDDFTVEIGRKRAEKMNGQLFQVIEV